MIFALRSWSSTSNSVLSTSWFSAVSIFLARVVCYYSTTGTWIPAKNAWAFTPAKTELDRWLCNLVTIIMLWLVTDRGCCLDTFLHACSSDVVRIRLCGEAECLLKLDQVLSFFRWRKRQWLELQRLHKKKKKKRKKELKKKRKKREENIIQTQSKVGPCI